MYNHILLQRTCYARAHSAHTTIKINHVSLFKSLHLSQSGKTSLYTYLPISLSINHVFSHNFSAIPVHRSPATHLLRMHTTQIKSVMTVTRHRTLFSRRQQRRHELTHPLLSKPYVRSHNVASALISNPPGSHLPTMHTPHISSITSVTRHLVLFSGRQQQTQMIAHLFFNPHPTPCF